MGVLAYPEFAVVPTTAITLELHEAAAHASVHGRPAPDDPGAGARPIRLRGRRAHPTVARAHRVEPGPVPTCVAQLLTVVQGRTHGRQPHPARHPHRARRGQGRRRDRRTRRCAGRRRRDRRRHPHRPVGARLGRHGRRGAAHARRARRDPAAARGRPRDGPRRARRASGRASLLVAVVGVVVPLVSASAPRWLHRHVGQGRAVRRRRADGDERRHHRPRVRRPARAGTVEARTVLGAAVADDVLGLVILTVVVRARDRGIGLGRSASRGSCVVAVGFLVRRRRGRAPRRAAALRAGSRALQPVDRHAVALALAFTLAFAELATPPSSRRSSARSSPASRWPAALRPSASAASSPRSATCSSRSSSSRSASTPTSRRSPSRRCSASPASCSSSPSSASCARRSGCSGRPATAPRSGSA